MTTTRSLIVATFAAGAILLAACGSDGNEPAANSAASASAANDPDVEFAQGMIAHHEQALEMAEMALDPDAGASAEVANLARRIQAAQDPEITQMTTWLTEWGKPLQMDESGGHDMESMDGMMTADEMDDLSRLTGPSFDETWLEMMIRHHQGAIEQSRDVKKAGRNADVHALADRIISAQQGEIDEMKKLLDG